MCATFGPNETGKIIHMEEGHIEYQKRKLLAKVSEPWLLPALAAVAKEITALTFPASLFQRVPHCTALPTNLNYY